MAKKTLWNFYDGEPFMENPQLGLLGMNPGRKRKVGKKMAVRRKRTTRRKRSTSRTTARRVHHTRKAAPARRRRSTRRRNWLASGLVVPANPRKRSRRRSANPKRKHSRRRAHRNPALLGMGMPGVKTVAFGAVGFVGPSMVSGFLMSTFPTVMQQITSFGVAGKYIVKIGSILGLSWLTKRFVGSSEATAVMVGGGINVGLSLANDFAPGFLPANPLAMYLPNTSGMNAYVPANRAGMAGMRGLRAVAPLNRQISTPASFPNGNGAPGASKFGGSASRYYRY